MALTPPTAPTQPNLGDPSTFNARALAQFNYGGSTLPNWIASLNANDYFSVLGQVKQTNGTPTGALMERGSSANGEWERFACGTQICTSSVTFPAQTATAGPLFVSTDDGLWTYPAQFSSTPVISSFRRFAGISWVVGPSIEAVDSTKQFRGRVLTTFSNASGATFKLTATGRWF